MAGGDGMEVEVARLPGLAGALNDAAAALDVAGGSVPPVPDAGDSTAVIADGLASLTETLGAFTAAIEASGAGVGDSAQEYEAVETANTGSFEAVVE